MFWRKKTEQPAHVKPKLRDVWIAARLAQVHAAGSHSVLSTIVTELGQIRTVVEQLRDAQVPAAEPAPAADTAVQAPYGQVTP